MSVKNKRCYIGFENGDLMCFWLNQEIIADSSYEDQQKSHLIRHVWKSNMGESIKSIIWIQSEDMLIVVSGINKIVLVACESGDKIAELT